MRRVLLIGPLAATGGVTRFVKDLLHCDLGYRIELFNTVKPLKPLTKRGPYGYGTATAAGLPFAARNLAILLHNVLRFPFVLVRSGACLVHVATSSHWSFWENALYVVWASLFGRPVVLHFLGDFGLFYRGARGLERRLIEWVFRASDHIFVLSAGVREMIVPFLDERPVEVIPSSVALPDASGLVERSEPTALLFMGGTSGIRKGVRDLLKALPKVAAECQDFEFVLCGSQDVEEAYAGLAPELRGYVRYCGLVDDATKTGLLSTARIYALPSYSEGMPYGIVEAMAAGLAVVASNVGSIPEMVQDGVNGFLVAPGDVEALADRIERLFKDPALVERMSKANSERARSLFSGGQGFDKIRHAYDVLCDGR